MSEQFVLLDGLHDNPYQPRMNDDAEHIENLARSIAADAELAAVAAETQNPRQK